MSLICSGLCRICRKFFGSAEESSFFWILKILVFGILLENLAKKIVSYVVSEFFDQIIEKSGVESPNYEGLFDSDPLYELLIKVEQSEEDLVIFNI